MSFAFVFMRRDDELPRRPRRDRRRDGSFDSLVAEDPHAAAAAAAKHLFRLLEGQTLRERRSVRRGEQGEER